MAKTILQQDFYESVPLKVNSLNFVSCKETVGFHGIEFLCQKNDLDIQIVMDDRVITEKQRKIVYVARMDNNMKPDPQYKTHETLLTLLNEISQGELNESISAYNLSMVLKITRPMDK